MVTLENHWGSDLDKHRRIGWYPITTRRKSNAESSKFSGTPMLYIDEHWPICPGCRNPMHLLLQINSESLPEEANNLFGNGYLQIFFCINADWNCEESMSNYEAFSKGARVRVVTPDVAPIHAAANVPTREPFPELAIVGWQCQSDYPTSYEAECLGTTVTEREAESMESIGLPRIGDKLLGWPAWQQGLEYPQCPECKKTMSFIFQIDSEDNLPYMFGDVGTAYITQCETHRDLLALTWACG